MRARFLRKDGSGEMVYVVADGDGNFQVTLGPALRGLAQCSCRRYGQPPSLCSHAIAALHTELAHVASFAACARDAG